MAEAAKANDNVVSLPMRLLERVQSFLMARSSLAGRLGMQFRGYRNLYEVYGYNRNPQWEDFWVRYQRQDIAARIIDAPVDATWSPRPKFKNAGKITDNKFAELDKQCNLWEAVARADKLCGVGRYSVLYIGLDDNSDPSKPVNEARQNKLLFVRPFSEASAKIRSVEQDPTNERFGLPTMYEISITGIDANGESTSVENAKKQVHWTRVIHIVEQPMESPVFGTPRLLNVFNLLDDLQKVVGGSAEVYWLTSNRGMQVNVDKDMALGDGEGEALQDEIEEYVHGLRRFMRTKGVKIETFDAQYPNPTQTFNMLLSLVSGTTGIPQRILLGAEAGHLASDQDRANWADRIDDRRLKFAEPSILRQLLAHGAKYGWLGKGLENTEIVWASAYRLSPKENAEQAAQWGRAIANFSKQAQVGNVTSLKESRRMLGLPDGMDGDPIEPVQLMSAGPGGGKGSKGGQIDGGSNSTGGDSQGNPADANPSKPGGKGQEKPGSAR